MASWSDKMATFQVWDTCIDLPSSSGFKDCHIIVKICIVPLSFSRLMMSVFSTALSSTPKIRISSKFLFFHLQGTNFTGTLFKWLRLDYLLQIIYDIGQYLLVFQLNAHSYVQEKLRLRLIWIIVQQKCHSRYQPFR